MKKKLLFIIAMIAVMLCIFAISVSAAEQSYSTFDVVLTDGTQKTAYTAGIDPWEGRICLNAKLYAEAPIDKDGTYEEIDWKTVKELDFSNSMLYWFTNGAYREMEYGTNQGGTALCIIPTGVSKKEQLISLEKVITGKAVTLREGAFNGAPALKTVVISQNLKYIQNNVFYNCTSLEEIIFEEGSQLESINDSFLGCTSLKSVSFPANIKTVGENAFYGCKALKTVTFAQGTNCVIKNGAFNGCIALENVTLVEGITSIGSSAFKNCDSLVSITIPNSVTNLGGAFGYCDKLEEIVISDNSLISNKLIGVAEHCPKLKSFRIPPLVTELGYDNFRYCSSLTEIVWPNNLTKISGGQNFNNTAIKSIAFPDSLTYMSGNNLSGCNSLEEIRFGANLTNLGDGMMNLKYIKRIYIPASITTIGSHILGYSNAADSSSNITFIFTGTKEQAKELQALVLAATEGTSHAPNSSKLYDAVLVSADEYDVAQEPNGFHLVYGYNLCDAFYNGEHAEGTVINSCQFGCGRNCGKAEMLDNPQHNLNRVEAFGEKGYFGDICINESCTVCKTVTIDETIASIFTWKGYSACTFGEGYSVVQGFYVNKAAIDAYMEYAPDFDYGILATVNAGGEAIAPKLGDGNVLTSNFDKGANDYLDIKVTGIPEGYEGTKMVLCVYVTVGEKMYYLDNNTTGEVVTGISYSEVVALNNN